MPLPTFGVTRNGIPILEVRLTHGIDTGLEFENLPGAISLYDELSACRYNNYRYWHDWQELNGLQKARLVAFYYLNILVENNRKDAEAIELKRQTNSKK